MTDYSELVERMRAYPANKLCIQIADALEAQAKEIAELNEEVNCWAEAFEWPPHSPRQLRVRIAELEAENKKLQDLVYRAYQEGFGDAPSKRSEHDNSGNDMAEAWEESYARAALNGAKDV